MQEGLREEITTAKEAIKVVKAEGNAAFAYGTEPLALGLALLSRGVEVGGIKVFVPAPGRDFAWYEPGWEETFQVEIAHVLPIVQQMIDEKRDDYLIGTLPGHFVTQIHMPGNQSMESISIRQLSMLPVYPFPIMLALKVRDGLLTSSLTGWVMMAG